MRRASSESMHGILYDRCFLSRLCRKAKYNLEKDLTNKFTALRIDEHQAELRSNSNGLRLVPGVAKISGR
jgi:Tektin family